MKYDVILSGVGGQGVLSVGAVVALGAMKDGLEVKQSEVHGMAQRGGAVVAHLRISDKPIASDLIGRGTASVILSMEPLESLRYLDYLADGGILITSSEPLRNIPDYPDIEVILSRIEALPRYRVVEASALAKEAGSPKTKNMVMLGAASLHLPVKPESLRDAIREIFTVKGEKIVDINLKAFNLGREK